MLYLFLLWKRQISDLQKIKRHFDKKIFFVKILVLHFKIFSNHRHQLWFPTQTVAILTHLWDRIIHKFIFSIHMYKKILDEKIIFSSQYLLIKMSFYCNNCVWKYLVWRGPKTKLKHSENLEEPMGSTKHKI